MVRSSLLTIACLALMATASAAQNIPDKKALGFDFSFRDWVGVSKITPSPDGSQLRCQAERVYGDGGIVRFSRNENGWLVETRPVERPWTRAGQILQIRVDRVEIEAEKIGAKPPFTLSFNLGENEDAISTLKRGNQLIFSGTNPAPNDETVEDDAVEAQTYSTTFGLQGSGGTLKRLQDCHNYWFGKL